MCGPLSNTYAGKFRARLGDPGIKITRAVDRAIFGWDGTTKYLGGGGARNPQVESQVALARASLSKFKIRR